jgi:hypothetical protein
LVIINRLIFKEVIGIVHKFKVNLTRHSKLIYKTLNIEVIDGMPIEISKTFKKGLKQQNLIELNFTTINASIMSNMDMVSVNGLNCDRVNIIDVEYSLNEICRSLKLENVKVC